MNFFFIAIMQNMLLAAAELPVYLLLTLTPAYSPSFKVPALNIADYALAVLFITILVIEMVSDNQQQRYQHFKADAKKLEKAGKAGTLSVRDQGRLTRGFVTEGLWSFSRHPVSRMHFLPRLDTDETTCLELRLRAVDVVRSLRLHHLPLPRRSLPPLDHP